MARFFCLAIIAFAFLGCEANTKPELIATDKAGRESGKQNLSTKVKKANWRKFVANEWYELFELTLPDNKALVSTAFLQLDAQLGIGVAIDIGVLANERGFKYYKVTETTIGKSQADELAGMLPQSQECLSYFLIEYRMSKPNDTDGVFETAMMVKLAQWRDEEHADAGNANR